MGHKYKQSIRYPRETERRQYRSPLPDGSTSRTNQTKGVCWDQEPGWVRQLWVLALWGPSTWSPKNKTPTEELGRGGKRGGTEMVLAKVLPIQGEVVSLTPKGERGISSQTRGPQHGVRGPAVWTAPVSSWEMQNLRSNSHPLNHDLSL